MKISKAISNNKNHLPVYLMTIIIAITVRCVSRISDSDALYWILRPTSWWVGVLSGIRFEYLPHLGFVNHFYRFLIAPECSGSRFMLIIFLMLVFSFLYRIKSVQLGYLWFGLSIAFSYIYTIFVNGIRITASVYLPDIFEKAGLISAFLTQEKLHTIIGTAVYFSFMLTAYPLADCICRKVFVRADMEQYTEQSDVLKTRYISLIVPICWYALAVLIIPLIGRAYRNEWEGFGQYAVLVITVCLVITTLKPMCGRLCSRK